MRYCSFCGKPESETSLMVYGNGDSCICSECAELVKQYINVNKEFAFAKRCPCSWNIIP